MDNFIKIEADRIDVSDVKNLLREIPNFNISDIFIHVQNGFIIANTLAHHAIETNNVGLLDYLISANVNLNVNVKYYGTVLHYAALTGNLNLVKKLHESGANINTRKIDNFSTPLIIAAINGYFEIAQYLIENGADVHAVTTAYPEWGHTALLIATTKKYYNIVELLLENNAEPCSRIKLANLNVNGVKNILSTTPNININTIFICEEPLDHCPTTLAHLAVEYENEELLNYLISANADLSVVIPKQGTVLVVAVESGDFNLVKKLCEAGADVNTQIFGRTMTPLIAAVIRGFFDIAEYLIENGANVNAVITDRGLSGHSALHIAAMDGSKDIVEMLLQSNADPNLRTISEGTPFMVACRCEDFEIIELFKAHGGIFDSSILRTVVLNKTLTVLDYLLSLNLDAIDIYLTSKKSDKPILHYALLHLPYLIDINKADYEYIEVILDAGANVNSVDNNDKLAVEITVYDLQLLNYVKRHVIKLIQADFYVCQRNIEAVSKGFNDYFAKCNKEVVKLKSDKVGTSNIVFYAVLHKSCHFLALRLRNSYIDDIIDKKELVNVYPIYGRMIYYKLFKVKCRIEMLNRAEEFLGFNFNYYLNLPYTFIGKLLHYLTNEDFKKLTQ